MTAPRASSSLRWALRSAGAEPALSGAELFVGRDSELAALQAAFATARAGRSTVVLLIGEAGIGKTRLTDEAAEMVRAGGVRVLRSEADPTVRRPIELGRGSSARWGSLQ